MSARILKMIEMHSRLFNIEVIIRTLILFLFILFFKSFYSQSNEFEFNCHRDSVIFNSNYGSVYITKDRSCSLYNWLFPDPVKWMEENATIDNFPILAKSMGSKFSLWENPNYWNKLYQYHEKYYVYGPSDWMANQPIYLTDSFLIILASDFTYLPIIKKQQLSHREINLILDEFGQETQLRIKMLSYPKGAALWKFTTNGETMNHLYVSNISVREFDLLNNDCANQKCFQEFNFDPIDFTILKF
jgi:hypothetical protein